MHLRTAARLVAWCILHLSNAVGHRIANVPREPHMPIRHHYDTIITAIQGAIQRQDMVEIIRRQTTHHRRQNETGHATGEADQVEAMAAGVRAMVAGARPPAGRHRGLEVRRSDVGKVHQAISTDVE
jgi:hypothetical protein